MKAEIVLNLPPSNFHPIKNLKECQLGIITKWRDPLYIGYLVMRNGSRLMVVGKDEDFFSPLPAMLDNSEFQIRPLVSGDTIKLT